ncbi:MAG: dephospho-CoA kinase, partial [Deltaproteobacteria bacterium]|nr:dephospho-CoA kinase [Deltaproteobacteria bacterium]
MDSPARPGRLKPREPESAPPPWAVDPEGLLKSDQSSLKVALTGGLASGKSTVAVLFEVFGAVRLDFDQLSREVVQPDGSCYQKVIDLFGPKVTLDDGRLDRTFISRKVFKDKDLRLSLEAIMHPEIWRLMLVKLKKLGQKPVVVIEVPLLYEAGLNSLFDHVILSFASPENQLRRLLFRNPKLSKGQAKRMISTQMPILEKLRRANLIIDNNGSFSVAIYQTKNIWDKLT